MKIATTAGIVLMLLSCIGPLSAQQGPPPVTVAKPVVKEIIENDEFVGRFEAKSEIELRARVSGYLSEVHFTDGRVVEKGDLLFTIEQRTFETALRQATAQINVAQSTFDFAQEQLERAEALITNGNISQSSVDQRREAFLAAQGALEQARAASELAQIDLEFTEIRAPISGRIDRRLVNPGNLVTANETVLTSIVSSDPVYFYFDIDERYFLSYARDARARGVPLQEGGGGLEVTVMLSDESIPPQVGVLDFSENRIDRETGTMRVRAVLENPDDILTPGLFGRINVPGSLPYEGVLVPDQAIVADQNRRLVMTVDGEGNVVPREVDIGPKVDGYRVVRSGLDGSETIVVEGMVRARPGGVVTPEMTELPLVAEN
ncbi:efflux RND transporter periplasmic adaptor subunit [Roseovarius aestuarii]|uniref:Efflux pump periplasmic linker BepF n=1 Tax=Roseovarius aestuarii TaxID=475083 RepID=A0A1X7BM92_9RHOB|nr:efflux RND transporter periplasmic adaptor subunit [Roseovarius aestuarii]SMC10741.1 Efflux pump periplasmic linker BepF [Roseovarius aestuarii]